MANPLLDQLRQYADQIDNELKSIDAEFDNVENLPFIGSVVAPFGKTVDKVLAIADNIRKTIDQLDQPAPAAAT